MKKEKIKKIKQITLIIISIIIFIIGIMVLMHTDFNLKPTLIGLSLLFLSNGLFVSQIVSLFSKVTLNNDFLEISEDEMSVITNSLNTINMINNSTL